MRHEPRARRVHMAIAISRLLMSKEALRHDEMEIVLGARHRHIEQTALLLELCRRAGAEIGRDAAIDGVEHEDRLPLLSLGGMNRRKDEIILIAQWDSGLVAAG